MAKASKKTRVVINEQLLKNDLKHYGEIFCKTVAEEAKYYIWEFAQYQIGEYYGEYNPYYYKRTDQEKNYSFHVFSERSTNGYRGGIIFDNSIIEHKGVPHKTKNGSMITEDEIEDFVWAWGYHGFEHIKYRNVDIWRPIQGEINRFSIIQQYVRGQTIDGFTLPIEKIIAKAKGKAQKGKYTMLHF